MSKSVGRSKATKKTRKNSKNLEDEDMYLDLAEKEKFDEEDLNLDDLSEDDLSEDDLSDDDLEEGGEEKRKRKGRETSMSKELNKMMNETIDDLKEGDMTMPVIGLGLIAIIGFALYRGAKV